MGLIHAYHVYADGDWRTAADIHFDALSSSGLLRELGQKVHIGIVGHEDARAAVVSYLSRRCSLSVLESVSTGWEQVTLRHLTEIARPSDVVFYAHTKGAWAKDRLSAAWRHSMTYDDVIRWHDRLADLADHDTSGAFWLRSAMPEHRDHQHFYAGNYWWAWGDYLHRLPAVRTEHRYQAEGWIGLGEPNAADCRPGLSYWGNFYEGPLDGTR